MPRLWRAPYDEVLDENDELVAGVDVDDRLAELVAALEDPE